MAKKQIITKGHPDSATLTFAIDKTPLYGWRLAKVLQS